MADPKELANKARSTLSQALGALQAGDDVPDALLDIAEPIAKTMGVLHKVERTGTGSTAEVDQALDNVRNALDALQQIGVNHPAVDQAMEAVAGSLSKMFALSKALKSGAAPAEAAPAARAQSVQSAQPMAEPQSPPRAAQPKPQVTEVDRDPSWSAPEPKPQAAFETMVIPDAQPQPQFQTTQVLPDPQPQALTPPVQQAQPQFQAAPPQPQFVQQPQAQPQFHAAASHQPAAQQPQAQRPAAQQLAAQRPAQQAAPAAATPAGPSKEKQRVPGMTDAPLPAEGGPRFDVELGAHSGSNFYKGLSGNDVIDHGGIFVATYKMPKVGHAVSLRVHLPGDLDFDGDAIVQWTREVRSGESEPGFGARFTRISAEGRQLVYRYVRNREPMFYDDL
jgi:hypothetical protein